MPNVNLHVSKQLRDTIEYYNENGSDCYLLLLDASKAFDRVEYVRLFRTLSDRNMCPIVLRLLMNMYINQSFQVKWNNIISFQNHVSNGVKQGGCLSPTLFSVYLNELIETIGKTISVVDMALSIWVSFVMLMI